MRYVTINSIEERKRADEIKCEIITSDNELLNELFSNYYGNRKQWNLDFSKFFPIVVAYIEGNEDQEGITEKSFLGYIAPYLDESKGLLFINMDVKKSASNKPRIAKALIQNMRKLLNNKKGIKEIKVNCPKEWYENIISQFKKKGLTITKM